MTAYVFMMTSWLAGYYFLIYRAKEFPDNRIRNRKKWFVFLAGVAMFLIMGLRHPYVGIDTLRYLERFRSTEYLSWKSFSRWDQWIPKEMGFTLVGKILKSIHLSNQGYLVLYAVFITVVISRLIQKYSRHLFWGFYLHATIGLFTMSMSGMRQAIACCICWLGIDHILNKHPIRFLLTVLVASTFHQSAIFFLVFYFVRYIKVGKIGGWIMSVLCLLTIALRPTLIQWISYLMPEKYAIYGMVSDKHPVNPMVIAIAILIPVFCLFFWDRGKIENQRDKSFYSLCFIGSFCYALITVLSQSSNMIGRMSQYFYLFNVILLGNVMADIEDMKTRYIVYMFAIVLPGYMFFKSQSLGIAPYYFFWQTYGM